MNDPRYFLDQDNSSHWYVVEQDFKPEWNDWLDSDSSLLPAYATAVDNPADVSFTWPVIRV